MSESRDEMIAALQQVVTPVLRDMGFTGSFPHLRRIRETRIDLLTFQFSRYGGSFVVELGVCPPNGFTTHWGAHIPPNKVRAHDIPRRLRLGSNPPTVADHWFSYEPTSRRVYTDTALEVLPLLKSQAEPYWLKE